VSRAAKRSAKRRGLVSARWAALALALAAGIEPRAAAAEVTIEVGSAAGRRGEIVVISVRLQTDGEPVAGTQNDIDYDPRWVSFAALADGTPDCSANSSLNKEASAFAFRPRGCDPLGGDCRAVRAIVLSFQNIDAIPAGSILYSCRVEILEQAPLGEQRLSNHLVLWAPPPGGDRAGNAADGFVTVLAGAAATHTPAVHPTVSMTVGPQTPTPVGYAAGDINCDARVDSADVADAVHAIFRVIAAGCSADCNRDGVLSAADPICVDRWVSEQAGAVATNQYRRGPAP
jgi:hypothetical protein